MKVNVFKVVVKLKFYTTNNTEAKKNARLNKISNFQRIFKISPKFQRNFKISTKFKILTKIQNFNKN